MRSDGDRLVAFLSEARREVLLCAPFMKANVTAALLEAVPGDVDVRLVTRWRPEEVAAGVSDLEVWDVAQRRPRTDVFLLDRLHAKVYRADGRLLGGSANLTAAALGWSRSPNLELLVSLSPDDDAVAACLQGLDQATPASLEERDRVRTAASAFARVPFALASDAPPGFAPAWWLPRCAAPARLFQVYSGSGLDRIASEVVEAAQDDLSALAISGALQEPAFNKAVVGQLVRMPSVSKVLDAAADDLRDDDGIAIVRTMPSARNGLPADVRWRIVREWLTHFLGDKYEIAPQAYVLRLRPGAGRT